MPATRSALRGLALAAAVLLPAIGHASCAVPGGAQAIVAEALDQLNRVRAGQGLAALRGNAALESAATDHACYMAARARITHVGAGGREVGPRVRSAGYKYRAVAENVAYGYADGAAVVRGWMDSPPHRKAMLRRDLREAGIGVRRAADGTLYWTLIMGRPR